jgi:hypothetical protein
VTKAYPVSGEATVAGRIDHVWNRMNSTERYELLRCWYPDCWAVNSMSLQSWQQLPAQFRYVISTNPRVAA